LMRSKRLWTDSKEGEMPKKKEEKVDRLDKYRGMSREELLSLRDELATQMPADDKPEVFTAYFDVLSVL